MMPYEFLEDVATADIAFQAWGTTLEETFVAAAQAVMHVMIDNPEAIEPHQQWQIMAENDALDMLLFDFLQELVYYKDAAQLMLRAEQVCIASHVDRYVLTATTYGEILDPQRHHQRVDVKAVTLHRFRLEHTERGWEALVILDI